MNRIVDLYKALYIDAEETSLEERRSFWQSYDQKDLAKRTKTLNLYFKDKWFVEKELLKLIYWNDQISRIDIYNRSAYNSRQAMQNSTYLLVQV